MKGGWCCGSRNEEFLDERNETRPLGGEGKGGESCGAEMVSPLYLKVTRLGIFSFFFFLLFHSFVTRGDAWTVWWNFSERTLVFFVHVRSHLVHGLEHQSRFCPVAPPTSCWPREPIGSRSWKRGACSCCRASGRETEQMWRRWWIIRWVSEWRFDFWRMIFWKRCEPVGLLACVSWRSLMDTSPVLQSFSTSSSPHPTCLMASRFYPSPRSSASSQEVHHFPKSRCIFLQRRCPLIRLFPHDNNLSWGAI